MNLGKGGIGLSREHTNFCKGRGHMTMVYLDNFDNAFSNKYKKILKI
jgi:hypothetical protein